MPSVSVENLKFVPIASYVAFAFIGLIVLVGLIARCLALNHSTHRSAYSLDLMIYQAAPKPVPVQRARRLSNEHRPDSNDESRGQTVATYPDPVGVTRIQRGPKNL